MIKLQHFSLSLGLCSALFFAIGCEKHDHDHAHGDHGHSHKPKHGGQLFELGDHFANVELLHDPIGGRLLVYLLDGHAEEPIKYEQDALDCALEAPAAKSISLQAQKSTITGSVTHFEGSDESLKSAAQVRGTLTKVQAKGSLFENVAFTLTTTKSNPQGQ